MNHAITLLLNQNLAQIIHNDVDIEVISNHSLNNHITERVDRACQTKIKYTIDN